MKYEQKSFERLEIKMRCAISQLKAHGKLISHDTWGVIKIFGRISLNNSDRLVHPAMMLLNGKTLITTGTNEDTTYLIYRHIARILRIDFAQALSFDQGFGTCPPIEIHNKAAYDVGVKLRNELR